MILGGGKVCALCNFLQNPFYLLVANFYLLQDLSFEFQITYQLHCSKLPCRLSKLKLFIKYLFQGFCGSGTQEQGGCLSSCDPGLS